MEEKYLLWKDIIYICSYLPMEKKLISMQTIKEVDITLDKMVTCEFKVYMYMYLDFLFWEISVQFT